MAREFNEFDFRDFGGLDFYTPPQSFTPEVMVNPYQDYYQPALPAAEPEPSYYTYGAIPSADLFDYEAEAERMRAEEIRQAELLFQRQLEEQRQMEFLRQQEFQRQEAARVAEMQRQEQLAYQAELARVAQQQEAARIAQEQEAARIAAEEAARAQQPVGGLTAAPEPEPSVEMFNWPDGTRRPYPPPPEIAPEPVGVLTPPPEEPIYTAPLQEERNVVTPLPTRKEEPAPPVVEPPANLFVEGADVPQSSGLNLGALDELFANLRKTEELQKLALEPGLLQQGFTGTSGVTAPPAGAGIFATPTPAEQPAIDFEVTPEMAGALQQVARPAEITAAEREAVTSNPRVQALQRISDQLKANDFAGAFDSALAAERDLGGDFVGNIIDANKLRELRGPMTAEEITKFYNEMPQKVFEERYLSPGNEFKKEQAIERNIAALGGQAGYVDPMLGVKKEETLLSKLPVKELAALAAAAMGATAIPGLFGGAGGASGAGAAGGAGAGGAGALTGVTPTGLVPGTTAAKLAGAAGSAGTTGGLGSAIKTVGKIPATIGKTVAETLGLPITKTVSQAALGNAIITGATTAAKGGDLEDVLKAALLSAGVTYVSAPIIDSLKDAAKAVGSKLGIATGAPATAAGTAVSDALSDVATDELLREVTVTATRPALSSLIGTAVGALPTSTKVDLPEPQIRTEPPPTEPADELAEVVVTSQRPDLTTLGGLVTPTTTTPEPVVADRPVVEEPIEQPLEEVVVTSERPPLSDLLGLGAVAVPTTTPVEVTQPEYIEDVILPEEEPLEEVVVTSERPPLSDLLGLGTVKVPTTTPVDVAKPDYIEDVVLPEEEPLEEVVVTGTRPPLADLLGLGTVKVPTTTPIDLPQPEVILDQIVYPEEVVVEGTKPTDGGLTLPPFTIPLQTPVEGITEPKVNQPNPLKDLLDKYGSLENLLKLLGALGSAASGTKGTTAPTAPTGGMGGALPKYTYTRTQLSPDIDYYTYGTRPEAKFFDYGLQLEKPTQPELPPAKPPGEEPVMAQGGLMGYAKGGSNQSRYFDGPGSGRDDKIPALLSDGEYVMDAETLALLGDGSTKEGARRMDEFRAKIRQHKGRALSRGQISPDAKSPTEYMGGGLA